jgi:protein-L-isoaspartate(D-aspartate) O-methyltransferase
MASCADGQPAAPAAADPSTTTEPDGAGADDRADQRDEMVTTQIEERGVSDPVVLAAMRAVLRHRFVPDEFAGQAYDDHPLPIGHGQTISQPYIVALMSSFLNVSPGDRVLEVGTGSGYQAAVLAEMDLEVYTIEIVPELADRASRLLAELGYQNLTTREGDGYFGWEEEAPFDSIIVTAAPDHVPQPLVQQLAPGGQMVIPVGPVGAVQTLWMFSNDESGELLAESLGPVVFVPLTGGG